nr:MAG TPA: hypothetical protein [Caudoviricetes sp.]
MLPLSIIALYLHQDLYNPLWPSEVYTVLPRQTHDSFLCYAALCQHII